MAKERLPAKRVSSNTFLEYNNQQLATATAYIRSEQKVETGYTWCIYQDHIPYTMIVI